MSTPSIWNKLFTALRGGASEAGEAIVDHQALRILDQEIRDADTALANARRELVGIMAKHKLANDRVVQYDARIGDLEAKAVAAMKAERNDLAQEVAEVIAVQVNERDVEARQATEFGGYVEKMRKDITKAEARIKSLRQQVDVAKARESVQKAQVSASIAAGGANGKLETAVGTLNRAPPSSRPSSNWPMPPMAPTWSASSRTPASCPTKAAPTPSWRACATKCKCSPALAS
jgi:phage shock protein A